MDDKKGKEGKAVERKDDIKRMDGREEIRKKVNSKGSFYLVFFKRAFTSYIESKIVKIASILATAFRVVLRGPWSQTRSA